MRNVKNCLINEGAAFFGDIDKDLQFKSVSEEEDNAGASSKSVSEEEDKSEA